MKWQPWATRFQLTLFALAAPLAAFVLGRAGQKEQLLKGVTIMVLVSGVPWIILNVSHPFIGKDAFYRVPRDEQYFTGMPQERAFFHAAVKEIQKKDCARVGLDLPHEDAWEYPLWPLLRAQGMSPEIRSIHVRGKSSAYEDPAWVPCAVVTHQGATP
jgi:hypothetical protein